MIFKSSQDTYDFTSLKDVNKIAIKVWRPINGVKDIAKPEANPAAKSLGEPFILFKLKLIYFLVLEKL